MVYCYERVSGVLNGDVRGNGIERKKISGSLSLAMNPCATGLIFYHEGHDIVKTK